MINRFSVKNNHLVVDKEWIKEKLTEKDLMMIDSTFTTLNNGFFAFTNDGYIIKVTANSIYKNQSNPIFSSANPYTIYNIKRFLFLNDISTMLLSTEYINNNEYLEWQCECGNIFKVPWDRFMQGQRICYKCARRKNSIIPVYKLEQDFSEKGYTLITTEPKMKNEKVEYICLKHKEKGIQSIKLSRFYNSHQGCRYCGKEKSLKWHITSKSECMELATNKGLNYIDSYIQNKKTIIEFTCKKHMDKGVQLFSITQLRNARFGCKYCNMSKYTNEEKIDTLLKSWNILFERQYSFHECRDKNALPFDFYLPEYNVIIEYQGEQHYRAIRRGKMSQEEAFDNLKLIQKHDDIKRTFCANNNIDYIEIPYWENEDIENFIFDEFIKIGIIEEINKSA